MFAVSIWTTLVIVLLAIGSGRASERPEQMGVALAYPLPYAEALPTLKYPDIRTAKGMFLDLTVASDGSVNEIAPGAGSDSSLQVLFEPFFQNLKFEPGLKDGSPVEQTIPISLWINQIRNETHISFPIDTSQQVWDPWLYAQALKENGAGVASIREFPSYFYVPPDGKDSSADLQYVLASVEVGRDGRVTGIELIHDPGSPFTDQILSAINWAEYQPAQSPTGPEPCRVFVVVSLFPGGTFPTEVVSADTVGMGLLDRLRVRMASDTVGLMHKPVPKRVFRDGLYTFSDGPMVVVDTVGAVVKINHKGETLMCSVLGAEKALGDKIRKLVANLRFFPARDFRGDTHSFQGLMKFEYATSTEIRIRFCWLEGEGF